MFSALCGEDRLRSRAPRLATSLMRHAAAYDVVVGGLELDATFLAYGCARMLRKPLVAQIHCDMNLFLDSARNRGRALIARAIYPRVENVVAVSAGVAASAAAVGVQPHRVTIMTGVDGRRIRALAGTARPQLQPPLVVSVGSLVHHKGFDLLINAHAQARRRGFDHRLTIAGDGPERARLRSLVNHLSVSDTVQFPGFVANPYSLMRRASLVCVPSRFEGFGLVIVEALALGVPVLACDCPSGPREILGNCRYGELVEPESPAALATALVRFLQDPTPLREKAQNGPERAASKFELRRVADPTLVSSRMPSPRGAVSHGELPCDEALS